MVVIIKKNILFLGPAIKNIKFHNYEKRLVTIVAKYTDYNDYDKVVDLGSTYFNFIDNKDDLKSIKKICNLITSMIDENTIAIIDTYYLYYSFFSQCEELYTELEKRLKQINNKDLKFFIARFMDGDKRIQYSIKNEERLKTILNNNVHTINLDNKLLKKLTPIELENKYIEFIYDKI